MLRKAIPESLQVNCYTHITWQSGQVVWPQYMIFKKDPSEAECRLAEKMGQKAAIKKLESEARGAMVTYLNKP